MNETAPITTYQWSIMLLIFLAFSCAFALIIAVSIQKRKMSRFRKIVQWSLYIYALGAFVIAYIAVLNGLSSGLLS